MITVGMGEVKLCSDPGEVLCALGLGSCIGVSMYEPQLKLAGMCHIVLPSSAVASGAVVEPGRYADTAVAELLRQMESAGAGKERIAVAVAGGAELFKLAGSEGSVLDIGRRNHDAAQAALDALGLTVLGTDVGGNCGRSLSLRVDKGVVTVKRLGQGEAVLVDLSGRAQREASARLAA